MKSFLIFFLFCNFNLMADENFPAGTGTVSDLSVQAFSHPLSGIRGATRREFTVGNSFFQGVWVQAPSSTDLRDGLGPVYNAVACASCHFKDGRGRGLPESDGKVDISLLFRLKVKEEGGKTKDHPEYGGQFNPIGLDNVPGEGDAYVKFQKVTGKYDSGETYELVVPEYSFVNLAYGKFGDKTIFSPRVGPQMIGLGLIENIKEEDILKNIKDQASNKDGVSGRANYVYSLVYQKMMLGRFGWKAAQPSLLEQNAAAFHGDIGITSYLHPTEDCTYVQLECKNHQTNEDISADLLNKVTIYTQTLAVPVSRILGDESALRGKAIFSKISCTTCHVAHYKTGSNSDIEVLNNQDIYPYSDFLLHDMGDALSDDKKESRAEYAFEGLATTREFRTPPLWGLGLVKIVNGHTRLMHDGRARDVEEAILWHGGEATKSKEAFKKLTKQDREDVVKFVNSL